MKRKIFFVSGSRADYRYLYWIIVYFNKISPNRSELIVTGSHLDDRFGNTVNEIKNDGLLINREIPLIRYHDSNNTIPYQLATGIKEFSKYFSKTKPDLIVIAGDRYEILAVAMAAFFLNIPIAHIGGGETTHGSKDDSIRHNISKMSKYHFTSNKKARDLLIKFGVEDKFIFCYGSTGLEDFYNYVPLCKEKVFEKFNFTPEKKLVIVTVHPDTIQNKSLFLIKNALSALDKFDFQIIFTAANADYEGELINDQINSYINGKKNAILMPNLGRLDYVSLLNSADFMMGNSSSGLTEAPSLGLPVVNIGPRQDGRLRGGNVIDSDIDISSITNAIKKALDKKFKDSLKDKFNPYYNGNVSKKIAEKLQVLHQK